ncbi:unnamed protein product [Moneuplotes crassus]|uniref:Uncharacterized protein n=1 Tax=Euplotes crassus TaxID=5936 RepID=A0AAD1Y4L5_EUPCR|nr:unnamed protein product [Moneuplotes crassus]
MLWSNPVFIVGGKEVPVEAEQRFLRLELNVQLELDLRVLIETCRRDRSALRGFINSLNNLLRWGCTNEIYNQWLECTTRAKLCTTEMMPNSHKEEVCITKAWAMSHEALLFSSFKKPR